MTPEERRIYHAKWRVENPEKVKAYSAKAKSYQAKWRAENPEKAKARIVKWRAENPEKVKDQSAKWRVENFEKYKASNVKWRAENPEKSKACYKAANAKWIAKNPEYKAKIDAYNDKGRSELANFYVKQRLIQKGFSKLNIELNPELIEVQRIII